MAEECNTHTNLAIDDKHTGNEHVEVFIVCRDCDGAWRLEGNVNTGFSQLELSQYSELHENFEPIDYEEHT